MTESGTSRLAELLGGLCLASDLANGFPPEKVLRTVVLAVEVGRRAGHDDAQLRDAFYVTMLRFLGCTGFAHEEAHIYGAGDDLATRNVMSMADPSSPVATLQAIVGRVGLGSTTVDRVKAVASLLFDGKAMNSHARAQCDTSMRFAELAGLSGSVRTALAQVCERYDGKGVPEASAGEGLARSVRLLHVADVAEIAHHRHGEEAALAELGRRAGKQLDPRLVEVFLGDARGLFDAIAGTSCWERFLAAEPAPWLTADGARTEEVAVALAHFTDLKSVHTLGHCTGVGRLAAAAGEAAGLSAEAVHELRLAALLHDVGRASVPNGIWDKPDRLGALEWERVRLHAYYTERVLFRVPALRGAARVAAGAHERLDASGYHRGVPSTLVGRPERLLAAADVLHALTEPRPHRPARTLAGAQEVLAEEVRAGRLDGSAVEAVLAAAGVEARGRPARKSWPRGLSEREVEVLRLLARGKSNREIGQLLGISPRTVQNHVAHAYDKVGVYSRAGAALFVTEEGLLQ